MKTQCSPTPHLLPSFSLSLLTQKSKFSKHRKTAWRYYYFTLLYHKSWSYEGWFLRYRARQTEFFVISGYFLPFYPPNNPENQTFEKMKKTPGGIMILNVSIINENHMMYDSWDMKCTRHIFVILGYFLSFYPYNSPKNENFKKMKKTPGDIFLHKCTTNHDNKLYCSWDMARDGCNCYFSFWTIFYPFTIITARKMKISKKWKNSQRYHHFTQVHQKSWWYVILFLRYCAWWI